VELIGDLERFVASSLYPNRAVMAIVGVVAIVGLLLLARRRGWFGLARRHPIWTSVTAVALLVVLGPVTWYLASPLFISTSVVEAAPPTATAPAAAVTPRSIAPATKVPSTNAAGAAPSGPLHATTPPPTRRPERKGTFVGADEFHFGSGTARLIAGTDGGWTLRFEDFAVRNGPDLYVYLSPRPKRYADGALELGRLKADTGAFNYRLPAGVDPADYRSVVIWCKQFAVQFAYATLDP
jgi:Electron transfer DM13